jgi:hypothetical protein
MECSESAPGFLFGSGPNDSRLIPDVLSLGICFVVLVVDARFPCTGLVGVVSSPTVEPAVELAIDAGPRFLDRIVTVEGMPSFMDGRGEERGGVATGAGSLDRAD